VADIVRGRGRGLTADTVRKTFGEGRIVSAEDAERRKMVDRLVPYPSEALTYAGGYAERQRVRADLDRMDLWFMLHGDEQEQRTADARFMARMAADKTSDAQRQADLDYIATGIRIAERS
jgi:enoyl-CoA hydratase/carnithine racemase